MNDTKFEVGMRVRVRYERNNYFGTVREVDTFPDGDEVLVKWDGQYEDEDPERLDAHELAVYDPEGDKAKALIVQPKIDEAADALERAYKLWQETQELYLKTFDGDPYEMRDHDLLDMTKFEKAFENSGWSTSGARSLYC